MNISSTIKNKIILTSLVFGGFLWGCASDSEAELDNPTDEKVIEEGGDDPQTTSFVWNQQGETIEDISIPFFGGTMDLNSTGNRIILGSSDSPSACSNYCDGVVRVYDLNNGTWTQLNQDLYGDNSSETDFIGHDVAINSDGNFIVASYQPFANTIGYYTTKVFQNINGNWVQIGQAIINSAGLGSAVALNAAGNILAVAMPKNNRDYLTKIYRLNNDKWEQIGEDIKPGEYAAKVALNDSGSLLAISKSSGSGLVSFYTISENDWQLNEQIEGDSGDGLSSALDLSGDGNNIILEGALSSSCNNCSVEPFFKIYERGAGGAWKQKGQEITFPAEEGYIISRQKAVAINQDGSRIVIGLKRIEEGGNSALGKLYIHTFQYSETDKEWQSMPSFLERNSYTGLFSLDMNDEGDIIAVGIDQSGRKSVEVYKLESLE